MISVVPGSSIQRKTGFAISFQKFKTLTFSAYMFDQVRCKYLRWRNIFLVNFIELVNL